MKNLVLGVAKGYSWDILEPFVTSFEKNCPSADLVLFVDDISDFTRNRLQNVARTHVTDIPAVYKEILIIHSRWKMCADFLENFGSNYNQVFLTDTRDVIFQGDVFDNFKNIPSYLGYAMEEGNIGDSKDGEKLNYEWLKSLFGKKEADKFLGKKIICCGTVIGTVDEMKIFCRIMWGVLKDDSIWGHEQAVMNYLVYENLLPIKNLFDVGSEIFTMGLTDDFSVRDGKFLRGEKIPAVVHQYDRCEDGIWLADKFYRAKDFSSDEHFRDTRSIIEQVTCLVFVEKFTEAENLLKNKIFAETDFENYVGVLIRLWEIVMRKPLSQESGSLELLAQNMLKNVKNFSSGDMRKICTLLKLSHEGRHLIDVAFKNSLVNNLLRTAKQCLALGEEMQYNFCVDLLKLLDVPI